MPAPALRPQAITRFGPFDILFEPDGGGDFDRLREHATVMRRFDIDIYVASVDDLVSMKRATGREKDASHLEVLPRFLEARKEPDS